MIPGGKFLSDLIFTKSYLFLRIYFALSSWYEYVNFIVDLVSLLCAMSSGWNRVSIENWSQTIQLRMLLNSLVHLLFPSVSAVFVLLSLYSKPVYLHSDWSVISSWNFLSVTEIHTATYMPLLVTPSRYVLLIILLYSLFYKISENIRQKYQENIRIYRQETWQEVRKEV